MDYREKSEILRIMHEVVEEQADALDGAGTLLELELVASRMGEEVARRIEQRQLERRAKQIATKEASCPDCGTLCGDRQMERTVLQSGQGKLCYEQPKYYCRQCRRHFFPDGRSTGDTCPGNGHSGNGAEDGLGGSQSG